MKKLIAIMLVLALVLSAWGCSAGQQPAEETAPAEKTPMILNADRSLIASHSVWGLRTNNTHD